MNRHIQKLTFKLRHRSFLMLFVCALFLSVTNQLSAQNAGAYTFSTSTGASLANMTGSTTLVGSVVDDTPGASIAIGFDFVYCGTTYSQVSASPDGFVVLGTSSFTAASQFANSILSTTNQPKIFPWWDDMATGSAAGGGKVHTILSGSSGSYIRIIEWFVTQPRATGGPANSTFQLWLYEGSNLIEFRYGSATGTSGSASVGISNNPGTVNYHSVTVTSHTSSNVTTNNSNTGFNTNLTGGRMYSFAPPAPCSATPAPGNTISSAALVCVGGTVNLSLQNPTLGTDVTYQWYQDGGPISGATNSTYTSGAISSATEFYCEVTCGFGMTPSNTVSVGISDNPVGGTASGPATALTSPASNYEVTGSVGSLQWQSATNIAGPYTNISGATNATMSTTFGAPGTYYIRCRAFNPGCTEDFSSIVTTVVSLLANNVCEAVAVPVGVVNGPYTNVGATGEVGEPVPPPAGCSVQTGWCNNTGVINSLWFTFVAPASGKVSIEMSPANWDSQLAIYSAASCGDILTGGATLIAANDDAGGSPFHSFIQPVCVVPGQTYYVLIDGYNSITNTNIGFRINEIIIDNSFTGLAASYTDCDADADLTPAVPGGTFFGPGITGSSFSPSAAGVDTHSITYQAPGACVAGGNTAVEVTNGQQTFYEDADQDGFGNPNVSESACSPSAGYVSDNTDCDDSNTAVNPQESEICDGIDNNCDGNIDEGVLNTYYADADGDGFGNPNNSESACSPSAGYVSDNTDCDDTNGSINPGATEICGNGIDEDCSGVADDGTPTEVLYADTDDDSYGDDTNFIEVCDINQPGYVTNNSDCDDTNGSINPGATEICGNGIDEDCDGSDYIGQEYFSDVDGDGYGGASTGYSCSTPSLNTCSGDFVLHVTGGYADESAINIFDNDNNLVYSGYDYGFYPNSYINLSLTNGPFTLETYTGCYYGDNYIVADLSINGISIASTSAENCAGYGSSTSICQTIEDVAVGGDCDDNNSSINPAVIEECNGIDDNCDGTTDEGFNPVTYYFDYDGDGYGSDLWTPAVSCDGAPSGYVDNDTDCDPFNGNTYPGATEICDNLDNNCDGTTDEGFNPVTYYFDYDSDGYGSYEWWFDWYGLGPITTCDGAPNGWVDNNTDCNFDNSTVYPGATEICDFLDNDCDGDIDEGITPPGDPSVFGTNQWIVYAWNSGGDQDNGISWNTNYAGFYTTSVLNFNSENDWCSGCSPSYAPNYQGCTVNADNHSWSAKRKGFPCGNYTIHVNGHDDQAELWINGVMVWQHIGCCDSHSDVWTGDLASNDEVEFRVTEGGGGSNGSISFVLNSTPGSYWYADMDEDGYYGGDAVLSCDDLSGLGYSLDNEDCNDNNDAVNPGATEVCNGIDDNCDGAIDEGLDIYTYYYDFDGDGYGFYIYGQTCEVLGGLVTLDGDCDDNNSAINPAASEVCNNADDDCNGIVDDGLTFNNYYVDADADGYGTGAAISSCNDLIQGNSADCSGTYHLNINSNGWYIDEASWTILDASSNVVASGGPYCCGTGFVIDLDLNLSNGPFTLNAETYGSFNDNYPTFTLSYLGITQAVLYTSGGGNFSTGGICKPNFATQNGDCDDANDAINPGMTEVCGNGIDDDCDGLTDEGCTRVQNNQCGQTLAAQNTAVLAIAVPGVQVYRFKIEWNGNTVIIDRPVRWFRFTDHVPNFTPAATYQVSVSTSFGGGVFGGYGQVCNVTLPHPTTQIQASQCGATLTSIGDNVIADVVTNATGYKFKISNGGVDQILVKTVRFFKFTELASWSYGTTYQVSVAVEANGVYGPYGAECSVTTPAPGTATTTLDATACGIVLSVLTTNLNAIAVPQATEYEFLVENTMLSYSQSIVRTVRWFRMSMMPGLTPGTAYTVKVRAKTGGVWGPYGTACNVTTPGPLPSANPNGNNNSTEEEMETEAISGFDAVAFPNPFADAFTLNIRSESNDAVVVRVYDMNGKMLENRNLQASEAATVVIGGNLAAGMYHVTVMQGDNVKTMKMIKTIR